jgi:hypothetical protein
VCLKATMRLWSGLEWIAGFDRGGGEECAGAYAESEDARSSDDDGNTPSSQPRNGNGGNGNGNDKNGGKKDDPPKPPSSSSSSKLEFRRRSPKVFDPTVVSSPS